MAKVAIVVLADTETHGDLGRLANALTSAQEFKEAGDEAKIIFDGAGTKWIPELSDPGNKYNKAFEMAKDQIAGACGYCASAFGVKDQIERSGVTLLRDYRGHPSLQKLVSEGYQVITF
ncbi:MAG: hypothetical protein K6T51_03585 [Rubrobacteraceae bacterium]|uniref:hypothetical protein n=1 Tax=Rubrobacter naiadicus TaxID=1392641 RepID=UPI00235DDE0A|nr:hypothetical protein [Rubrobacter naiadicus]MBX6763510.1 DsrE family protein [Rubrobacteraceae bacterium]MCL6437670.1 hypothetical protein [Rubrobacteraceae bacterium]